MTLLTIIQDSCDLLSLPRPSIVIGSSDQQVRQLLAFANEEGRAMAKRHDWQKLMRQTTFSTTATEVQTGAVPTDWDRFLNGTVWDRTTRRQVIGPITPQEWQAIQANPAYNRVFMAFRLRDSDWLVTPTPGAGETVAYEYLTKNWCESSTGTGQTRFAADTDVAVLDGDQIVYGIRWRFLQAKGLDYAEAMKTYEQNMSQLMGAEKGAATISITGSSFYFPLANIPEGSWPSS